jgi:cyclohexanone monooxygenase
MRTDVDVVVVGAGFAGLYALHKLRGLGWTVQGFEAGSGVGGTWYWNRYPGARCDVESVEYSYSFDDGLQQEWEWTERYAGQPEILRYLDHVADRYDLRPLIRFDTRVAAATFATETSRWTIETDDGEPTTARFFVMATGCLSSANLPAIEGLDDFEGDVFHTGRWPHHPIDFTGKRVAVIGTGSSGIQAIPVIAAQAEQLTVFQRTPNYSVPARNAPLDPGEQEKIKSDYAGLRERNLQMATGFGSRSRSTRTSAIGSSRHAGRKAGSSSSARTPTCCSTGRPTTPPPSSCGARSPTRSTTPRSRRSCRPRR